MVAEIPSRRTIMYFPCSADSQSPAIPSRRRWAEHEAVKKKLTVNKIWLYTLFCEIMCTIWNSTYTTRGELLPVAPELYYKSVNVRRADIFMEFHGE